MRKKCPECFGAGTKPDMMSPGVGAVVCWKCQGDGYLIIRDQDNMTDIDRPALRNFMAEEVMGWKTYLGSLYGDGKCAPMIKDDWHPDLDSNQLDMLIDKMVEDGWGYSIMYDEFSKQLGPGCVFFPIPHDGRERNFPRHLDRRLAVLLAIKVAKEE